MDFASAARTQLRIARQPICDRKQRIFAYELLFRDSKRNRARIGDGEQATANVILTGFIEMGLEGIVGTSLAFVNVTRDFILDGHCRVLPKNLAIVEILENIPFDSVLKTELHRLKDMGYRFALDDYTFQPESAPFLEFVNFVKIDMRQVDRPTIKREFPGLRRRNVSLIAEKVETREEFDFCRELGFDYFQGYFFCRPELVSATTVPLQGLSVFRLLAELHAPDIDSREIERLVGSDLPLSYKLLRYINSAHLGLPHTIQSVAHAVRLAGIEHVRQVATLIVMARFSSKPNELLKVSVIRAKMCELVAEALHYEPKEAFFTVGLFSTIDAFLDRPMQEAMSLLPLSESIQRALLNHEGRLGEVLNLVFDYEETGLDESADSKPFWDVLEAAYWKAVQWEREHAANVA